MFYPMASGTETEVKVRLGRAADIVHVMKAAGFRVSVPRLFEANTLYDTPDQDLRRKSMLLRLREVGDKVVLTWKGRNEPGAHKIRPERETTVGSAGVLEEILGHLGYHPSFRYEKYRTEFVSDAAPSAGVVTVDETPIGDFLEIEGPADWIDATARKLGFTPQNYILESYGALYLADCAQRGVQPSNMVFASHNT
ncbi:MAG: class IV adenylate cyclase [Acidobacteriaceae bacterium]|nr:class IV adenylate cyclase [Acidobacteriaceae bacterium]